MCPPRSAIDFVVIGDFIDVFDTISLSVKIPEKEKLENSVQSSANRDCHGVPKENGGSNW